VGRYTKKMGRKATIELKNKQTAGSQPGKHSVVMKLSVVASPSFLDMWR